MPVTASNSLEENLEPGDQNLPALGAEVSKVEKPDQNLPALGAEVSKVEKPDARARGVDYSKWDALVVSDSNSEEEEEPSEEEEEEEDEEEEEEEEIIGEVKVDMQAICVHNSEDYAREPYDFGLMDFDDFPPWLTFKRGDRLHILKFLSWECWHAEDLDPLPDWRPWRHQISGLYVAALTDGTVGSVPPAAISFADDADTDEEAGNISFSLPPTPDWQLPIDAFFFTPSEAARRAQRDVEEDGRENEEDVAEDDTGNMSNAEGEQVGVEKAEILKKRGNDLLSKRDFSGAIAAYTEALALIPPAAATGAQPSLPAVLLSNRSHVHCQSGANQAALDDAAQLLTMAPTWFKSHLRRAQALACLVGHGSESIEAFDDALALCTGPEFESIKSQRDKAAQKLRASGSSDLPPEVFGGILAVPQGFTVTDYAVCAATLSPTRSVSDFEGEDNATAVFPGDRAWPMVCATVGRAVTGGFEILASMCYYIVGPCLLTSACCKKLDSCFKHESWHATRWPGGASARTCPFCGAGLRPGTGEVLTMVCHMLCARMHTTYGRGGGGEMNIGQRLMMQLVCSTCTRRMLKRAVQVREDQSSIEMVGDIDKACNALPLLRRLCNPVHAGSTKAGLLWPKAQQKALLASITQHCSARVQACAKASGIEPTCTQHHRANKFFQLSPDALGVKPQFFDKWIKQLKSGQDSEDSDEGCKDEKDSGRGADAGANSSLRIAMQRFTILQADNIRERRAVLRKFWDKHGSVFRRTWMAWDRAERERHTSLCANIYVTRSTMQLGEKLHNFVEDLRPLVNAPFGNVPEGEDCLLQDIAATVFADTGKDLLKLLRQRIKESCLQEDVEHVARLKSAGKLPKLFHKNGDYLCRDMLEAGKGRGANAGHGPFVVFAGSRASMYGAQDAESLNTLAGQGLTPEFVTAMSDYSCLRESEVEENIMIRSAVADGTVRTWLQRLLEAGAVTEAPVYIYAALKQNMLLDFLVLAVGSFGEDHIPNFDVSKIVEPICYVCGKREAADGSKLLTCAGCKLMKYCSRECQKRDYARHKESCSGQRAAGGLNALATKHRQDIEGLRSGASAAAATELPLLNCALPDCGKALQPPILQCSKCHAVVYCSRACQVKAWKAGHKLECSAAEAAAELQACLDKKNKKVSSGEKTGRER